MPQKIEHTRQNMSDAEAPDTNPDSAEAKFVQLERELVQETSVIALMKDQMTSMFGMVFMLSLIHI